jgi:hypothetical protein
MAARLVPLALAAGAVLTLLAACGDSDSKSPVAATATGSKSTTTAQMPTGSAPVSGRLLAAPASQFSLNQDDLGKGFITDIPNTKSIDADFFASSSIFDNKPDGNSKLSTWGYIGGFRSAYVPEGRTSTLLNGGYAASVDSHLFTTEDGARQAYAYIADRLKKGGAQSVNAPTVGAESIAWTLTAGTFPNSTVNRVVHTLILRQGNLIAIVQTQGAEGFMKVDTVVALAQIVDEKALGKRPIVLPTPVSNYTPPVASSSPSPSSGSPATTATPGR